MKTSATHKPLAITMGDPAGIGPEVVVKSLLAKPNLSAVVYGDPLVIQQQLGQLDSSQNWSIRLLGQVDEWEPNAAQCIQMVETSNLQGHLQFARIMPEYGRAAASAITQATQDVIDGFASAIVTAPIQKESLKAAGVPFPGHTEMLAHIAGNVPVRMMLANPELRTVLVTIHQSVRTAIDAITQSNVLETIRITDQALKAIGISKPRIAVAGLNPHAGEGGLFGREEIETINPAIAQAQQDGIQVSGPYAADTIFGRARHFAEFDVVVAMLHDQGLIPVKYFGIEEGVNITLGLPFVRTSVDHGTAFDIAGQNKADHRSMLAAIAMAQTLIGSTDY